MWQRIIETLNNFSSNEQVYILILHEENNFDSINSFGGFGGFDTFESDSDKNWKNMQKINWWSLPDMAERI